MLKPANVADLDSLTVVAYANLAKAALLLREASRIDISLDERKWRLESARGEMECCSAHFLGAVDSVPLE